jgi:hypothetical protein
MAYIVCFVLNFLRRTSSKMKNVKEKEPGALLLEKCDDEEGVVNEPQRGKSSWKATAGSLITLKNDIKTYLSDTITVEGVREQLQKLDRALVSELEKGGGSRNKLETTMKSIIGATLGLNTRTASHQTEFRSRWHHYLKACAIFTSFVEGVSYDTLENRLLDALRTHLIIVALSTTTKVKYFTGFLNKCGIIYPDVKPQEEILFERVDIESVSKEVFHSIAIEVL